MRDNIKTPLAIFSVERGDVTKALNEERTQVMRDYLKRKGIPANEAQGTWGGETEVSFVIHLRELTPQLETIIFSTCSQDAVLTTDINGAAYLHYEAGGKREVIGTFTEVPSAVGLKAFTKFGSRVYTVIPFSEE